MILNIIYSIFVYVLANCYYFNKMEIFKVPVLWFVIAFLILCAFPGLFRKKLHSKKMSKCRGGIVLIETFLLSLTYLVIFYLLILITKSDFINLKNILINLCINILVETVLYWCGIIRVYLYSNQLGIKWRFIGYVVGMIPIVNLCMLLKIIKISKKEIEYENEKCILNEGRKKDQICKTKYPILLVHGVFFRDSRYFNYWGRIPGELEDNGATIFYGNHQSAAAVKDSGEELKKRINDILEKTGSEKINIIAHSKGGLDSRYMISKLGMEDKVASLTTINTPNRGCEFADYLLTKLPKKVLAGMADKYNSTLRKLGDDNPDFIASVEDLTASRCKLFNEEVIDSEKVYYQSVGSKLNVARGGRFPLNLTHNFVKLFDGDNDGLVGKESFRLGDNFEYLTVEGKRGISHGDVIDLNRENLDEFDVREFYVQLVSKLKEKGF